MAALFWVAGSTAYDGVTNCLATTTGGTATVAAITAADTVTFDANSPAAAAVTTSAAISATAVTLAVGFTGSLTMSNTFTTTGAVTHSQGTLNTNGQTCNWGSYTNNLSSSTRTLTMGSSAIACSSASPFTINTAAGMTITANTAIITFSGASANAPGGGAIGYNGASFVYSGGGTMTWNGVGPIANLTVTGTASKASLFGFSGNLTMTGTWTLGGNTTQGVNRLSVFSNIRSQRTITAAAVVITGDVDFSDILLGGSPTWSNAGSAYIGDGGNNGPLITSNATSPLTLYRVGAAGNYSASNWSLSSGGSTGQRVPLLQDSINIDSNASGTIVFDMPRPGGNLDFTGFAGTASMNTVALSFYGNVKFSTGMAVTGTSTLSFSGVSNQTLTTNGKSFGGIVSFDARIGTYTLQDDLTTTNSFLITSGTFVSNGKNISALNFQSGSTNNRSADFTNSTVTLTGSGNVILVSNWGAGQGSFVSTGSTFLLTNTSASNSAITPGGSNIHFNNVTISGGGTGAIVMNTGAGQIWFIDGTLNVGAPKTITFHAGFTYPVGNLVATGSSGNLITIQSDAAGSAATISLRGINNNLISCDWLSLQDSAATPHNWYAGANSTNVSGNSGWIFSTPPTAAPVEQTMMGVGV